MESDSCCGVSVLSSAVRHRPGIGTYTTPLPTPPPKNKIKNTLLNPSKICQYVVPLSSLQPPFSGIFRLGQCHFPLCMWIIEIRLSTVIVHGVEPSVIVNQNVLRDFTTQEKRRNRWTTDCRKKTKTWHERAFIVLCIYAIVYVWIWRIWKYMLTNLYRVFYVMWNTWSRCSLLSLSLAVLLSFVFSFFSLLLKTEHIRRIRLTSLRTFWTRKACSHLRRWIQSETQVELNCYSRENYLLFTPAD